MEQLNFWAHDHNTHVGFLTEKVFDWAECTFPHRNDASMYLKMYGEIAEMIESDGDANEIADMFILLLDYAKRKKVDVTTAVLCKLDVNQKRTWMTDKNGVNSHVE
jgi:hypothetical protein